MNREKPDNTVPATLSKAETIEKFIEEKRKNLEAIFDAVPVGLLLVNEDLIVVRVNDAIRRIAKRDYDQIINKSFGGALGCKMIASGKYHCCETPHCKICPLRVNILRVFETFQPVRGVEFQSDTYFQDRNTRLWFSLSVEPVDIDGRKYVVVCLNDITERKLSEEKLHETMEMKSRFISTVSHELRTPLAAIKEGLNIVLEGEAGRLNKKQKQFLELSRRNVDRLSMLVNDVLDFQKLESGRMRFDFDPGDMAETVKEAAQTMAPVAKKAEINMSVEIKSDCCQAVFDHNRMIQLITNLLSNAIKFTPAGGKVVISIDRQNGEMVIVVSDTGMGIPKDDLPRIFERFYRIRRPGKEIPGTGLGLPIVAQIIEHHGGKIMADSEPDKGTTFTIILPLKPPQDLNELDSAGDEILEETIS
ncbi:MAG: hypothetical protein CVV39_02465 [Planctomycetes bacterium HGW-Planctomycetes-1]|nr:MAG: hypothetical protein CVV39_02465 [Planctomycetes bacterium HGW-Planctomycetes-1]